MYINENNQYTDSAEYFYNKYTDLYCIIGTTYSAQSKGELQSMFASPDLLHEVPQPDYITADYDGAEW